MKKTTANGPLSPLAGTEREFLARHREALCREYEAELQRLVADWEATAAPVAELRDKRFHEVRLRTSFGTVVLACREGRRPDGRWHCPARAYLGLRPNQRYAPDVEKRLVVLAAEVGSYEKAARVADTVAWFAVSDGTVHATVQRLAEVAQATPLSGPCAGAAGPADTLIIMADGWNARHRGENWGRALENRQLPARVRWHEIRSAVIFRLSALLAASGKRKALTQKHVVAVPAETSPTDFGHRLEREAVRMGLRRARAVFFVMDGGVWLWRIFENHFEKCSQAMLDFYHLSQHLHTLAAALHGAGTAQAAAWCGSLLHDLKHHSPAPLFKTLDDLLREAPAADPAVRQTIAEQNRYFRNHANHLNYAVNAAQGVPIGSGSVESLCAQFQNRLKRTGQFWGYPGFGALLQLIVRYWNGELDSLWRTSAA